MIVLVVARARLLAPDPASFVLPAVFPYEFTLSMALVFLELADVLLAVGPYEVPLTVHLIVQPFACVFLLIAPNVDTLSLDLIHLELSLVD